MRSDPLSTDQVFDGVDGVSFVHNLVWASMSGKELITSTDWRSKKHVGVDRLLCDGRVIFDQDVEVRFRLLVSCDIYQDVLSSDPFIHTIRQRNLL